MYAIIRFGNLSLSKRIGRGDSAKVLAGVFLSQKGHCLIILSLSGKCLFILGNICSKGESYEIFCVLFRDGNGKGKCHFVQR